MEIPVYHIEQLDAFSTEKTSIGVKRLEQGFKNKQNIRSSHRHSFYQIIWVTRGRGAHLIDFNTYPIEPFTLYFLSPGQVHEWKLTEAVFGYIIAFTNKFFSSSLQDTSLLSELPYFYITNTQPLLCVGNEQAAIFNNIIQRIETEYQASLIDHEAMLSAYLRILLIEAKRIYCPNQTTYTVTSSVLITKQFLLLIEENFLTQTFVSEYAKLLGITANHLNETVKRTTGKTAGELIRDRLLLEAKRLLIYSELSISEIAHKLNFEDPAYFGRFFKRYAHCSPSDFRQQATSS
ncbi:MAG: helix-turn-helix domain-containing protein [Chroococcidiopsidaceae cyanobacterium CP_BM_ER_R8_30]|nr:helix-turn-helix domain-containing protein [Chroococcidiopsidaceae cyanobacterium CP_BM_ER_R8_30]